MAIKKLKHEAQLQKKALDLGLLYAKQRGFDTTQMKGLSHPEKVECIYRLLVQDQLIIPLPADQEDGKRMKHKLALWLLKRLPEDHPLKENS